MKKFDVQKYSGKKVLVIQDLSQTNGFTPEHAIMKLSSAGAHVFVAMRANSSSRALYENSPLIKGVVVSNGASNLRSLLAAIRTEKFDTVFLFLPSKILEKYIPYIGLFLLVSNTHKKVLIQKNAETVSVSASQFWKYLLQSILPYSELLLFFPFIYLHNQFRKQKHINPKHVKKILFIRLDHIGDTILATPLLDALKTEFPNAVIDGLMGPWSAELYRHDDRISHMHVFSAPWYARGEFEKGFSYGKFQKSFQDLKKVLRNTHYDLAIDSRGDSFDSWIAYKTGARYVVGSVGTFFNMAIISNRFLLTHISEYGNDTPHASEQHQLLAETIAQKKLNPLSPSLRWNKDDQLAVEKILLGAHDSVKIAIHATSGKVITQWPQERFMQVITELSASFRTRLSFYLIGSTDDFSINEQIQKILLEENISVENLAGMLSLPELSAFLSKIDLLIANDSGPAHVGSAVGTRVIALYLPSRAKVFAPRGEKNVILLANESAGIESIAVSDVVKSATEIIKIYENFICLSFFSEPASPY